jgi:hypothetical protein
MRTKSKLGSIRFSMIMIIVAILSAAVPVHASVTQDCKVIKQYRTLHNNAESETMDILADLHEFIEENISNYSSNKNRVKSSYFEDYMIMLKGHQAISYEIDQLKRIICTSPK